jgi:hypothetical protein
MVEICAVRGRLIGAISCDPNDFERCTGAFHSIIERAVEQIGELKRSFHG